MLLRLMVLTVMLMLVLMLMLMQGSVQPRLRVGTCCLPCSLRP
jgi:hypothetical protein